MKKVITLKKHYWITTLVTLFLVINIGVMTIMRMNIVRKKADLAFNVELPKIESIFEIEFKLNMITVELSKLIDGMDQEVVDNIYSYRVQFYQDYKKHISENQDLIDTPSIEKIDELWTIIINNQDAIFKNYSRNRRMIPIVLKKQDQVSTLLKYGLRKEAKEKINKTHFLVSDITSVTVIHLIIIFIVISVITFIIAYRLGIRITKPLGVLLNYMLRISSGSRERYINGLVDDEFGKLGRSLTDMVASIDKTERTLATINAQQGVILSSVELGMITLNKNYRINPVYSDFTRAIFDHKEIAGKNFIEEIYPDPVKVLERNLLERFLNQVSSNRLVAREMLNDINPLNQYSKTSRDDSRGVRIFNFDFFNIENQDSILVIISDITERVESSREKERERLNHQGNLEVLYQAIQLGPNTIKEQLLQNYKSCQELESRLLNSLTKETLEEIHRETHTIKGISSSLGLEALSSKAHLLEDKLAKVTPEDDIEKAEIIDYLNSLSYGIEESIKLIDKLIEINVSESGSTINKLGSRLEGMIDSLSKKSDKEINHKIALHEDLLKYNNIDSAIIHLVRNAISHGIEDPYERLAMGKQNPARLFVTSKIDNGTLSIDIKDDGKGLDYDRIRDKAQERGLLPKGKEPQQQDLIRAIFHPGFSSKNSVDTLSGRGVGLDAVKKIVKKHNGNISITSSSGKGTIFKIKLPQR